MRKMVQEETKWTWEAFGKQRGDPHTYRVRYQARLGAERVDDAMHTTVTVWKLNLYKFRSEMARETFW